jgi:hypothetical protein
VAFGVCMRPEERASDPHGTQDRKWWQSARQVRDSGNRNDQAVTVVAIRLEQKPMWTIDPGDSYLDQSRFSRPMPSCRICCLTSTTSSAGSSHCRRRSTSTSGCPRRPSSSRTSGTSKGISGSKRHSYGGGPYYPARHRSCLSANGWISMPPRPHTRYLVLAGPLTECSLSSGLDGPPRPRGRQRCQRPGGIYDDHQALERLRGIEAMFSNRYHCGQREPDLDRAPGARFPSVAQLSAPSLLVGLGDGPREH